MKLYRVELVQGQEERLFVLNGQRTSWVWLVAGDEESQSWLRRIKAQLLGSEVLISPAGSEKQVVEYIYYLGE